MTLDDLDAEDEDFTLGFTRWWAVVTSPWTKRLMTGSTVETSQTHSPSRTTRTQEYNLTTDDDAVEGGADITVTVTANPAHLNGSADAVGAT